MKSKVTDWLVTQAQARPVYIPTDDEWLGAQVARLSVGDTFLYDCTDDYFPDEKWNLTIVERYPSAYPDHPIDVVQVTDVAGKSTGYVVMAYGDWTPINAHPTTHAALAAELVHLREFYDFDPAARSALLSGKP
jgi:hypothetical protein